MSLKKFRKAEKIQAIKTIYDRLDIPKLASRKADYFFDKAFAGLTGVRADSQSMKLLQSFTRSLVERQA